MELRVWDLVLRWVIGGGWFVDSELELSGLRSSRADAASYPAPIALRICFFHRWFRTRLRRGIA